MSRYFTIAEAERLLPTVDRALRDAIFQHSEYQSADGQLNQAVEKIRMAGGSRVNPGPLLAHRARRDMNAKALKDTLDRIEGMGVLIKDLDTGLIDFLTLYHGREVCLCWRLGEDRITTWHGIDEGFRGRKPIDSEFVANHEGEEPD